MGDSVPGPREPRGISRRTFIRYGAALASTPLLAQLATACGGETGGDGVAGDGNGATGGTGGEVVYDGEVFDAGGATLNVGNWGGFWEETQRKASIEQFEQDFNCRVSYDSGAPFYPKMAVAGVDSPPLDVYSFDQDSDFLNAPFIESHDAVRANCPNAADLWDFAWVGSGVSWAFSEVGHTFRSDLVDPPAEGFGAIFEDRFENRRGWYIPENGVGLRMLIAAGMAFGSGPTDEEAAFAAIEDASPWRIVDFTGTMQSLLERGEVEIAVQHDAEIWDMQERGVAVDFVPWSDVVRPLLPQQFGVARGSSNKRLAYAYLNRVLSPEAQEVWAREAFMRPTNRNTTIPDNLAAKGVENTEAGTEGLDGLQEGWRWWFENEERLVERLNTIFAG